MSAHHIRRFGVVLTTAAVVAVAGAGAASAEPAGNAEITRSVTQGAGNAQVEGTAADGGAIDVTATANGGNPSLVGSLLGGLVPGLGRSGPTIAVGNASVDVTADLEPGAYRATVTIDGATGSEAAGGDASATATASASVAPTGSVASEQGDPSLGRDSTALGAATDVVLGIEFEVGTAGSYTVDVDLAASAQADGKASGAVATVSSDAVDVEITPRG